MEAGQVMAYDVWAFADYLGIDRYEFWGGWRHKDNHCPHCAEEIDATWIRGNVCPQCWRELNGVPFKGVFFTDYTGAHGELLRFERPAEFAHRVGVAPATVYAWIRTGKLNVENGLVPNTWRRWIDLKKCNLRGVKAAA